MGILRSYDGERAPAGGGGGGRRPCRHYFICRHETTARPQTKKRGNTRKFEILSKTRSKKFFFFSTTEPEPKSPPKPPGRERAQYPPASVHESHQSPAAPALFPNRRAGPTKKKPLLLAGGEIAGGEGLGREMRGGGGFVGRM